jgi:hypothetical protein
MVGLTRGLGCKCCGNDACGLGHDVGFYEDDFTTRDPGWKKFNSADQTQWDLNWSWDGSKLIQDLPAVTPRASGLNFYARRQCSAYVLDRVEPRPFTLFDASADVLLERPRTGEKFFVQTSGQQNQGRGNYTAGGIGATEKQKPEEFVLTSPFVYEGGIQLVWQSGYKSLASDEGPMEAIGINLFYPGSWLVQSSQIQVHTNKPFQNFSSFLASGAIYRTRIMMFNPTFTQRILYPENTLEHRLRIVRGFSGQSRTLDFYLDSEHLVTVSNPYATGTQFPIAITQWCDFSLVLGLQESLVFSFDFNPYVEYQTYSGKYDNYEQNLFI